MVIGAGKDKIGIPNERDGVEAMERAATFEVVTAKSGNARRKASFGRS